MLEWNRRFRMCLIVFCLLSAGCVTVEQSSTAAKTTGGGSCGTNYECLKVFTEVLALVQKHYIDDVDTQALVYSAIKGMLKPLDAATAFMEPAVYREVQTETKGVFAGIGLQLSKKEGRLTVISAIDGSPAQLAGVRPGDHLMKINEEPTADLTLIEVVQKLRGPKDSKVALTIERKGLVEPLLFQLTRQIHTLESVRYKILDHNIGYVRVSQFQENTAKDVNSAVQKFRDQPIRGLILDLRNNPGGLLTASIAVAELFLEPSKLIVTLKTREGRKDDYVSKSKDIFAGAPIIVLVNRGTASGAEIVAGALQDWDRATVIGTPTFGRGTVQTILPLSDGSGLRLPTARYYSPKGKAIEREKIQPEIVIEEKEEVDAPLSFAIEKLTEKLKGLKAEAKIGQF